MLRLLLSLILAAISIPLAAQTTTPATAPTQGPPEDRGVYAIWVDKEGLSPKTMDLPFLKGGQVIVLWSELEVGEGKYDFAPMDKELKALHDKGLKATVQVNGNKKPAWMKEKIPYYPGKLAKFGQGEDFTPMFWHPDFIRAYTNFLSAYAKHLKQSPYRDTVMGIRMNFNAIGTEKLEVNEDGRKLENWVQPEGSTEPLPEFSKDAVRKFQQVIFDKHIEAFVPDFLVFVRANVPEAVWKSSESLFAEGKLGWFQTGALPIEQPDNFFQTVYGIFGKFVRDGKSIAYAEPIKDSFGYGGNQTKDLKYLGAPRFNYWRLLMDLHYGITYIACYGADLSAAVDGSTTTGKFPELQQDYLKAFEFTAKYAGYLHHSSLSPGAWVALRKAERPDPKMFRTDDCEFLMRRLDDDSRGVTGVGPKTQRYGGWARVLDAGKTMRFALNQEFAASVEGQPTKLRVIYLDDKTGELTVKASGEEQKIEMKNTGEFEIAELEISNTSFQPDAEKADISLTNSGSQEVTLHMLEVTR